MNGRLIEIVQLLETILYFFGNSRLRSYQIGSAAMQKTRDYREFFAGCEFGEDRTSACGPRIVANVVRIIDGVDYDIIIIIISSRSQPFIIALENAINQYVCETKTK